MMFCLLALIHRHCFSLPSTFPPSFFVYCNVPGGFSFAFFQLENPDPSWLSDKAWDELCRMCDLRGFKDFRFVNA